METTMNPTTIEAVLSNWEKDCKIDETDLIRELVATPNLHAKYLDNYVYFKGKLAGAEKKYNLMAWKKRKYFRGEFEKHELTAMGWSQWNGLKPSSSELNQLLDMDKDMNDLQEMTSAYKTAVSTVEFILKQIQSRDWAIKSMIEYNKYLSGN